MFELREKDPYSPIHYVYDVHEVLHREQTPYQDIAVVTNPFFGRMLILDGVVQFTERDECFYHEMLAHPLLHAHPEPLAVAVIGGGDGGVIREVLKHPGIEKAYLIEIDEAVIRVSREFFPNVASALNDPRLQVVTRDGALFLQEPGLKLDVILVDSTDIVGFAKSLFSPEFFANARATLGPNGMFATLSESLHFHLPIVREVQNTLKSAFPIADLYTAPIATYAGNWWCFAVGSNGPDPRTPVRPCTVPTRYYGEEIHRSAFLPKVLYDRLMQDGRTSF